ncbi:MAG: hypothetical protein CVV44_06740 [Spirochaetae bacterium HGW-Spirochaetae-1]|jgi:hypothetical protein|nr:MAG: hypothetical protein CVV44_06740 [Spirochaetae bacterium HGW-Spirochaetae-1]
MPKITPINRVDKTEKYIVVPRLVRGKIKKTLKRLIKVRGYCYFTQGVALGIIDFIYRAVVKLGLGDRKLIFSRGSVRAAGKVTGSTVEILELDWDLGTSIIIPMKINYHHTCRVTIDSGDHRLKIMEIIVLSGLLKLKYPEKPVRWRNDAAAAIIALGWKTMETENLPSVYRLE